MTRWLLVALLAALLALGAWTWRLDSRNDALRAERDALTVSASRRDGLNKVLAKRAEHEAVRAAEWRDLYGQLAQVEDSDACRSTAIDRALDILRARRAGQ